MNNQIPPMMSGPPPSGGPAAGKGAGLPVMSGGPCPARIHILRVPVMSGIPLAGPYTYTYVP